MCPFRSWINNRFKIRMMRSRRSRRLRMQGESIVLRLRGRAGGQERLVELTRSRRK
jgi:hypothetical protein